MPRAKRTSDVGTAVTRLNAVRHGLTAQAPVIPGVESTEEWEAHRAGLEADLAPAGALEQTLVERIASLSWRIRRVARYECESIAVSRERVEFELARARVWSPDKPASVADAEVRRDAARRFLDIIEHVRQVPPDTRLATDDVEQILADLAAGADSTREEFWDGIGEATSGGPWTAARLFAAFKAVAAREKWDFATLLVETVARARTIAAGHERAVAEIMEEQDRMGRERLLPDAPTLERIVRYETALNRMLFQALNQLEAAQARRAGAPAPLHRIQAYGLPGG
ncbi:MAG: hypothetical protein WEC75_13620 [Dehalococcoidia bacterium]